MYIKENVCIPSLIIIFLGTFESLGILRLKNSWILGDWFQPASPCAGRPGFVRFFRRLAETRRHDISRIVIPTTCNMASVSEAYHDGWGWMKRARKLDFCLAKRGSLQKCSWTR